MKLRIDGQDIQSLSPDQIGATLQHIAHELMRRGCYIFGKHVLEIGNSIRNVSEEIKCEK